MMSLSPNRRMALVAGAVFLLDQLTKWVVLRYLAYAHEKVIISGFFKFVYWGNTGAAWSLLVGNNGLLALVALVALVALYWTRNHFGAELLAGQLALGLIFGGICGNLLDRLVRQHVVDFLYFYVNSHDGREHGFPAFNVADSAICIGVGLIFLLNWKTQKPSPKAAESPTQN